MRIIKTGLLITAATLALAGCKKEEAAPAPAAEETSAAPASAAPVADASSTVPDNNTNPIKP